MQAIFVFLCNSWLFLGFCVLLKTISHFKEAVMCRCGAKEKSVFIGGARNLPERRLSRQDHWKSWVCATKSEAISEFQGFFYVLVCRRVKNNEEQLKNHLLLHFHFLFVFIVSNYDVHRLIQHFEFHKKPILMGYMSLYGTCVLGEPVSSRLSFSRKRRICSLICIHCKETNIYYILGTNLFMF